MSYLSVFLISLATIAPGVREIPLDQIWAHSMPGTKKIQELQPDVPDEKRLMAVIGRVHSKNAKEKAKPAFAVEGTGLEALREAMFVITQQKKRSGTFPADKPLSIVFYSHTSGYYVHLTKVELQKQTIRIRHTMSPHMTQDLTQHFALINVGQLPMGKYNVEIIAEPLDAKLVEAGFKAPSDKRKASVVSPSFKFEVR